MSLMKYSSKQWLFLKTVLGLYLIYFFTSINSLFSDIISKEGIFSGNLLWNNLNWLRNLNLLDYNFYWILGVFFSLVFIVKDYKINKIILHFWWVSWCINFPFYLFPPHIAYIGFTLLLVIFVNQEKTIPKVIFNSFIYIWGLGFTVSGLMKFLYSSSWQKGQITEIISQSPLGYDYISYFPEIINTLTSYSSLGIELLSFPLVLWSKTRKIGLIGILILQLGILITMNIPDLTIGIIIGWLFLFLPKEVKDVKKNMH